MLSVLDIIKKTTDFFAGKGIETPRLDAELLIGHALGLKRMQLYLQFERLLTESELEKIRPLVRRRAAREPLQYVMGEVEWSGLKLKTDRRALIPRPETELLVEIVTENLSAAPARILDLGTGTGALALALLARYPEARATAVDESEEALSLARENAASVGIAERVDFLASDWFSAVPAGARYDVIVANPPYLTAEEVDQATPEVRTFEPHRALVAEEEGTSDLLHIIASARAFLAAGGLLAMETGIAQHARLLEACATAGFARSESRRDLTGRDRFVLTWAP
jgi:protein-(glutamine-N5) methyltransferase, release factor-specific